MSDPERQRQGRKHRESRRRLRRRLEAEGVDPEEIKRRCAELAAAQLERRQDSTWDRRLSPDDTGYRPTAVDPLERGPARATTRTAQAARRRRATTRFELHEGDRR